ncbi:MAG TPA: oligosaccharide flippase family protein [bacterium]|nr:oligosaccharide flippase family protein [bacterium]
MSGSRLAKNSAILIGAEILRRALSFVVAVLVARSLIVDDFGRFGVAMALMGIFSVVAGFGLNPLITRLIASDPQGGERRIATALGLKIVFGLGATVLLILLAALLRYPAETFMAVTVAAFMLPAQALEDLAVALFDGRQRMKYSAAITLVKALLLLLLVVWVSFVQPGLAGVMMAYLAAGWLTAAFALLLVRRVESGLTLRPRLTGSRALLAEAFPFLLIGLAWMIAFRVDTVMLERLTDERTVGLYRAGYSFFEILLALPILVTRALFPALAAGMARGGDSWRELLSSSLRTSLHLALPLAIGCALLGARFVPWIYGAKYTDGGPVAALLGGFLWVWFGSMTFGWALTAAGQLKTVLVGNVMSMTLNIVANLVLIPRHGAMGAACATVLSEFVLLVFLAVMMQRRLGGLSTRLVPWRALPAGVLLAVAVWFLGEYNLLMVIVTGEVVYLLGAWFCGAFNHDERLMIVRLLTGKGDRP